MLLDSKVFGRLKDGNYTVELIKVEEVPGKNGKDNFLKLTFLFEDGRKVTETVFSSSVNIMSNQLHEQLNAPTGVTLGELLGLAQEGTIDIWVSHVSKNGRTYRNINFQPQYTPASTEPSSNDDDIDIDNL